MSAQQPTSARVTVDGFTRQPWSAIPVDQVMRSRVLTCRAGTPMRDLARMMVTHAVHAVVVVGGEDSDEFVTGIVTDRALAQAGAEGRDPVAEELADPETPTVSANWSLEQAARHMLGTGSAHIVVIDGRGAPIGMLSTLDLARIMAWGHA